MSGLDLGGSLDGSPSGEGWPVTGAGPCTPIARGVPWDLPFRRRCLCSAGEVFDSAAQQRDAVRLGIWIFLATKIVFFGGAFVIDTVDGRELSAAFHEASRALDV